MADKLKKSTGKIFQNKEKKMNYRNHVFCGDSLEVLKTLPSESVQCIITSPPYWGLRDYGFKGQIGMEKTPEEYVNHLVVIFHDLRRVLRQDGVFWLNLGDSYFSTQTTTGGCSPKSTLSGGGGPNYRQGSKNEFLYNTQPKVAHKKVMAHVKPKDLIGIPWMVAFALRADGWYLRSDIIWAKNNPMPESVTDRPTRSHEYLFLLTKSKKYYYDNEAIKEPLASSSIQRISQKSFSTQIGGDKDYGPDSNRSARKTLVNLARRCGPNSRANVDRVPRKNLKQDAIGKGTYVGFKERYKDQDPVQLRNCRDVWTIAVKPYMGAHFATFPEKLVEPCVLAGSKPGDIVMDPFAGSGTTLAVAKRLGRDYLGIEGNHKYMKLIDERLEKANAKS